MTAGIHHHRTSSLTLSAFVHRLYKYDNGQLARVSLPEDQLKTLAQPGLEDEWSQITDPSASASQRDALAADLFSLPTDGMPARTFRLSHAPSCTPISAAAVQAELLN